MARHEAAHEPADVVDARREVARRAGMRDAEGRNTELHQLISLGYELLGNLGGGRNEREEISPVAGRLALLQAVMVLERHGALHALLVAVARPAERPTIAGAKKQMHELGMTLTHRDGEFRVDFGGTNRNSPSAYYTNDLRDAVATGIDMARRRREGR